MGSRRKAELRIFRSDPLQGVQTPEKTLLPKSRKSPFQGSRPLERSSGVAEDGKAPFQGSRPPERSSGAAEDGKAPFQG